MLPVQRRDGALWMRPEPLADALRELRQLAQTSPGAAGLLPHPPEAFDGGEVMSAGGWQARAAPRAVVVVEGRVERVRPRDAAPLNHHPNVCAGVAADGHPLMEVLASVVISM
jgi:hypothetical protein